MTAVRGKTGPWLPTPYDNQDAHALRAMAAGKATEIQQQRAMKFIIENVCGTYDLSYRPDSQRDTDFAEGKRYVGLTIVKLLKVPLTDKTPLK